MAPMHKVLARSAAVGFTLALVWGVVTFAQDADTLVTAGSDWIFEDIEAGYAEALATGKPLLVTFR